MMGSVPHTPAAEVPTDAAAAVTTDGEYWIDVNLSIPDAEWLYNFSSVTTPLKIHD